MTPSPKRIDRSTVGFVDEVAFYNPDATVPNFTPIVVDAIDPVVIDRYDIVQLADTPTGSTMRPIRVPPMNRKARRRRAKELRCAGKASY